MVHIYYSKFDEKLQESKYQNYLDLLPEDLQSKNLRYMRWQDRHSHLFGKLLLLYGMRNYNYANVLGQLQYNTYTRPYIEGNIDFNISHSGKYVLCAIAKNVKVGIDIEEIKEINFEDFKRVMTAKQWDSIYSSSNPAHSFFNFWTIKESVIKADSRGLSIPLKDIDINNNKVDLDNQSWFLTQFSIDKDYSTCLAVNKSNVPYYLHELDFYQFDTFTYKTIFDDQGNYASEKI